MSPSPDRSTLVVTGARIEGGDAVDFIVEDGIITETGTRLSRAGASVIDAAVSIKVWRRIFTPRNPVT